MLFAQEAEAANAAGAFVNVVVLILLSFLGAYVLVGAAHAYLAIVQGTASGADEVEWPDDPFLDRVGQAVYLFLLLLVWLLPVALLARSLRRDFLPGDALPRFLVLAAPVVWLFFPVGLLSSLSAASPLTLLR